MKVHFGIILTLLGCNVASASPHLIVCGNQPGAIYFTGLHPEYEGFAGFYYSADGGQNLEMRKVDSSWFYCGGLLSDATDSTFHSFSEFGHILTTDGGFHWTPIDTYWYSSYAIASGTNPGEIYNWAGFGYLYYSTDYGEYFSLLNNLYQMAGIIYSSQILNGTQPGDIYVYFNGFPRIIYRIYNYGANVDTVSCFDLNEAWYCDLAVSRTPGELYFLALAPDMVPGGTMRIYHTTNYGESWDLYEHQVPWAAVKLINSTSPSEINLQVYPNPVNAQIAFTLDIPKTQHVSLRLYNLCGPEVARLVNGWLEAGSWEMAWAAEDRPSGVYFYQLQVTNVTTGGKFILLK